MEEIRKSQRQRRKTEARERRKTIDKQREQKDGSKDEVKTQAVKDNDAAPADKDLLAEGNPDDDDDDDESSSTEDLLDGYTTAGGGIGEGSPMTTGKSQQTKVLRLARLLQDNNSGRLPISMHGRPSGVIKPFMGAAGAPPGVAKLKNAYSESKNESDDEKASEYITPMGAKGPQTKNLNGMKVLDTDSTQAKLQAPKGPQKGRKIFRVEA